MASRPRRLFVEFFGSRAGAAVLSLGTFVFVTRGTPVATAGVYISAISYATLLFGFLDLGTGPNLVRSAVEGSASEKITHYIWTRLTLTAIVVVLGALGVLVLFPADAQSAGFISLLYVAASVGGAVGPVSQVIGDARPFRIVTIAQGALVCAAVGLCVLLVPNPSADLLVATYGIAGLLTSILALAWVRRHMAPAPLRELPKAVSTQLRAVAALALATGAGSIYLRIDQSIVLRSVGSTQAAFYGMAARINIQARLVPSALQLSISTFLAHHVRNEGGLPREARRTLTRITLGCGVGLALAVVAVSDLAVRLLAGPSYSDAVIPAIILSVSLVATASNYVVGTSAIMAGLDRSYLAITLVALAFNVLTNIALVPSHGIEAAAAIAAITETGSALAIATVAGASRGATHPLLFLAGLGLAITAASAKIAVLDSAWTTNAIVSCLIAGAGAGALLVAYRSLGRLESARTPPVIEDFERLTELGQ